MHPPSRTTAITSLELIEILSKQEIKHIIDLNLLEPTSPIFW